MELQRDVFIQTIFEAAKTDKDIIFLTADLGAKALDAFREELPKQCLHVGISEQNMIDLAAGLSQCGKKVYCYAMAPFATLRCFEQIRVSLGAMKQPVTIIGVGVGYGYDDAGPTHYATEDLACMRTIAGMEIYTPCDSQSAEDLAEKCIDDPKLRYIRLDRAPLMDLDVGQYGDGYNIMYDMHGGSDSVLILASGYMVHRALVVRDRLSNGRVVDLYRIKPFPDILHIIKDYEHIVTLEEHFLTGGFGSAILEALNDNGVHRKVLRLGSKHHYYFENGGRNYVHELAGIDEKSVHKAILELISPTAEVASE